MKGIAEPEIDVSGNGSVASTLRASTAERTIVIVLAQVVVLVALLVIWRTLVSRRAQN